ncbi:helix-turn-helix domain-containing protein [Streptomyces sp. NPDC059785]|uniref:helix-turn-helix domain-containing protein n=1 Tax=Streptomyces sp. NPDC059785 TaxID=3346945 RepID=UPI00365E280F
MLASARSVDAPALEYYLAASARSPIALRLVLGRFLRILRREAGIEAEEAGKAIRASEAKISRMERGLVTCKPRDVTDLLVFYGVTDAELMATFAEVVQVSRQSGWWHAYDGVLPEWFGKLIGLQEAASIIRACELELVPGLLQTAGYAGAVVRQGYPFARVQEIRSRVALRMERQEVLVGADAPRLWAVLDEAVLRRPVGGEQVMRQQLYHLAQVARLDNITVQIAPLDDPACAAAGFPITHLRFELPALPDIVYLEQLRDADYLDEREEAEHCRRVLDHLAQAALSPQDSLDLLQRQLVHGQEA